MDTYNLIRDRVKKEEEEAARQIEEDKKNDAPDPLGNARQAISNRKNPKRRLKHASTTELNFASKRQKDEINFMNNIEDAFDRVVDAM